MSQNILPKVFLVAGVLVVLNFASSIWKKDSSQKGRIENLTLNDINFVEQTRQIFIPSQTLIRFDDQGKETPFTLKDFKGKPMIIHFWGSNCIPCKRELPAYVKFVKNNPNIVNIPIMVAPSSHQTHKNIVEGLKKFNAENLPTIADPKAFLPAFFELEALPTTIFINAKGKVTGSILGIVNWDNPKIVELLKGVL